MATDRVDYTGDSEYYFHGLCESHNFYDEPGVQLG